MWAMPWLLLLLDRDWPYAALLHDPWIYLGHAIDPWDMFVKFNGAYHARFYYTSRLSIIMPLAAAHAMLPALVANFLVRLVLFEVSVLCVFDLLARRIGRKTGLLTAFIMGTNYFFLDAIGRDYSDAFAIAYILAAVWGVSRAGGSRGGLLAMAFAGASTVALVSANLAYVILAPIPIACYAVTRREHEVVSVWPLTWPRLRSGRRLVRFFLHVLLPRDRRFLVPRTVNRLRSLSSEFV